MEYITVNELKALKEKDDERFERLVDKKKLELERQLECQKEKKLKFSRKCSYSIRDLL